MADDNFLARPGGPDINDQFKAGNKIRRTRRIYDRIKNRTNGDYNFGELTAFFHRYDEDEDERWQDDIDVHYRQKHQDVVDQIRRNVITVLSKVDPHDSHTPISLTFVWDEAGQPGVTMTADAAGHAHTMKITGLKAPSAIAAEKRKTKSY
jgi:hypothetical protein